MYRLIKIILVFISQSVSQMLAYKTTSISIVIFGTIFSIGEVLGTQIYYKYTDYIMGWDKYSFLILLGTFSLIQYIYQFLFVIQHEEFMDKIIEGELDYDLIRPIDSQLLSSFRFIDIPSLINMIIPVSLILYVLSKVDFELNIFSIISYIIFLIIGVIFYYCLNQFFVSMSFWVERPGKLMGVPEYLFDLASRPRSVYPKYVQMIFVFLIPVLPATNVPIELLNRNSDILTIVIYIILTLIFLILTRIQWKKGIKRYTSTN